MRSLIRWLDRQLCRRYGVFSFTDDPDCLLRLQVGRAPHELDLDDQQPGQRPGQRPGCRVAAGEPVIVLHLWNEHMPPVAPAGSTVMWAARLARRLEKSFCAAGRYVAADPRLASLPAVGGTFSLLPADQDAGSVRLMRRLGFTVMPYCNRLGSFGEFWENFYSWILIWAYNPASLRGRSPFSMHRSELWMCAGEFLSRYS